VTAAGQASSPRKAELLERAYAHVLEHGLVSVSLRPLADSIGSSPRVLLFLFGSKDGLVRALLARARDDELALLARARADSGTLADVTERLWGWLADPDHRRLLTLWVEAYGRSLINPDGPWGDFARDTVTDWLDLLAAFQSTATRASPAGAAERTAALALLRGALLDLLATGDRERITAAVTLRITQP
jgi:AcrR family transcriptional regulator